MQMEVLRVNLEDMAKTVRARQGRKIPIILSVEKVQKLRIERHKD